MVNRVTLKRLSRLPVGSKMGATEKAKSLLNKTKERSMEETLGNPTLTASNPSTYWLYQ